MDWVKGEIIGRGSFGTVNLATTRTDDEIEVSKIPSLMAVKSSLLTHSSTLQKEKEILTHLNGCPQILSCFGEDYTIENGEKLYNIFLEFASNGNLSQLIKNTHNPIPISDIKFYTKSITKGLDYIHEKGFVHNDIKPQNILLCSSSGKKINLKIGDFGLSKMSNQKLPVTGLFGTPLYMSPESISRNENETPSDIWALGCVLLEMLTGKPAWNCDSDVTNLLFRIGFSEELPEIPNGLSEEAKDFLKKCFIRDPTKRWTTKMLLNHPFIAIDEDYEEDDCKSVSLIEFQKKSTISPRSAFDFPESWSCSNFEVNERSKNLDRIRDLAIGEDPIWSSSDSWLVIRQTE